MPANAATAKKWPVVRAESVPLIWVTDPRATMRAGVAGKRILDLPVRQQQARRGSRTLYQDKMTGRPRYRMGAEGKAVSLDP